LKWRNRSLRRRLILWLLVPLFAVGALLVGESYLGARRSSDGAFDRTLLGSALAIAERVVVVDRGIEVDLPYVALEMLTSMGEDRVFYKIVGPQGEFITGYRDLPEPASDGARDGGAVFYDSEFLGTSVRIVMLRRPLTMEAGQLFFSIFVAETTRSRQVLAREAMTSAAARFAILVVMVSLIAWIGVTRGIAPLNRLGHAIDSRTQHDMRPFEHEVPIEVRSLVDAINDLMGRLGETIGTMRRFVEDASHQLRSPLAALQAQTELAIGERDAVALETRLARLFETTRQTSRLADQLLSLARLSPEAAAMRRMEAIDLAELAAAVCREWVPRALEKGIDLGFEGNGNHIQVAGDETLLSEMLNNLLDNAVSYCPAHSHVTVRVRNGADGLAVVEVEDDGPGIPGEFRQRVFDRFFRVLGNREEGCGLGLAIVKETVEAHAGAITLGDAADGKGLMVRVALPSQPMA
jgi:two-component system, OmpR family, sensor histidine kinase TctE